MRKFSLILLALLCITACAMAGEVDPDHVHTASCADPTTCIVCGATTGDGSAIGDLVHNYEYQPYTAEMHSVVCGQCGVEFYGMHSAVCSDHSEPDACFLCGAKTSDGAQMSYVEHDYQNQYDATRHWIECTGCGLVNSEGNHYANSCADTACAVCGATEAEGAKWYKTHKAMCDGDTCTVCGILLADITSEWESFWPNHYVEEYTMEHNETEHWQVCPGCGYVEPFSKGPHSARCDNPGTCSRCGVTVAEGAVISNITHAVSGGQLVPVSATEHGRICDDCGEISNRSPHCSTCDHADVCSECGASVADGAVISVLYHTYDYSDMRSDANEHYNLCTVCGEKVNCVKHYSSCQNPGICGGCGATAENGAIITVSHGWTETLAGYAPTCAQAGLTDGVKCNTCGNIVTPQEVIPALDHTEEDIPAVAATCTATGLTAGKKCSVCGEIILAQEVVPALGHTEEDIPAVAATCMETGLTAGKKCSVCGEIILAQEVVPALGHKEEAIPAVAASCTETGLTAGKKCSVCGEILTAQEVVPALGHTLIGIDPVEPTCTETGLTYGIYCPVCMELLVAQQEVPALGHTEEEIPAVAATCTEPGLTAGVKCSVCGEILTMQETVPATNHDYVDGVCSVCGEADPEAEQGEPPAEEPEPTEPTETPEETVARVIESIVENEALAQNEAIMESDVEVRIEESGKQVVTVAITAKTQDEDEADFVSAAVTVTELSVLCALDVDEIKVTDETGNVAVIMDVQQLTALTESVNNATLVVEINKAEPMEEQTLVSVSEKYKIVGDPIAVKMLLVSEDDMVTVLEGSQKLLLHLEIEKTAENTVILFIDPDGNITTTEAIWMEATETTLGYWEVPYLGEGRYLPVVEK